jgi:hypothetical protein
VERIRLNFIWHQLAPIRHMHAWRLRLRIGNDPQSSLRYCSFSKGFTSRSLSLQSRFYRSVHRMGISFFPLFSRREITTTRRFGIK